ncbi:MAG: NlpC/P60 family protein [Nocardioidaceae bacterium]
MRHQGRTVIVVCIATFVALTLSPGSSAADPHSKPTLAQVQRRVEHLDRQAEQASERFNTIREQLKTTRAHLSAVQADFSRQRSKVTRMQDDIAALVVAGFQGSSLGTTASLVLSNDPDQFLRTLSTVESVADTQSRMFTRYLRLKQGLDAKQAQLRDEVAAIRAAKVDMAKQQATINKKSDAADALLSSLKAAQREKLVAQQESTSAGQATNTGNPPQVPASGRAKIAVDFALAQLGDPYVYGAAGPDTWDCSGLTMGAWGAAGVYLPHSSSMQYSYGTPVAMSDLQPGDLVFFYSPISHVAIYIGGGQVVHAPHTGDVVRIAPMSEMPYAGAVRPG